MFLCTGGFQRGLIANVTAGARLVRVNYGAQTLGVMLEEWPRQAHCREIVRSSYRLVGAFAAKFEDFIRPLIGASNMVGASPRVNEAGGVDAFFLEKTCVLRVICREMTGIGEMLLHEFANRIERGVNLLLEDLIKVARTVRRFHAQRSAAPVEKQCLCHEL